MSRPRRRAPGRVLALVLGAVVLVLAGPALLDWPSRPMSIASASRPPPGWADIGAPSILEAGTEGEGGHEGEVRGDSTASGGNQSWDPPADAAPTERQANYLWAKSNELRADNDERTLKPMDELMDRARSWSAHMASKGGLEHSDIRTIKPRWTVVGENVGRSDTIEDVTARLFASPSHRKNILDRRFTHTGVGTNRRHDGVLYVAQVFWRG